MGTKKKCRRWQKVRRGCKTHVAVVVPSLSHSGVVSSVGFILLLIKTSLNRRSLSLFSVTEQQPNPIRFLSDIMHAEAATTTRRNAEIKPFPLAPPPKHISSSARSSARFRVISRSREMSFTFGETRTRGQFFKHQFGKFPDFLPISYCLPGLANFPSFANREFLIKWVIFVQINKLLGLTN